MALSDTVVFVEADGTKVDCFMNIDVKQNDSGNWFYSFAIEKETALRTLLAGVTENSATVPTSIIHESTETINPSSEISSGISTDERFALTENAETKEIHGYTLNKDADVNEDLLEELSIYDPSAEVSLDGRITVYHRTNEESAAAIRKTGIMRAMEDALFFSSKSEGYASDYGDTILTFKIPSTQLRINDIFEGEVHFDMPLKRSANGWSADVRSFLVDEGIRFALSETTQKITAEMSDAERTEILLEKRVVAPIYTGQDDLSIYANKSKLESEKIGIVAEVIQKLAQDFGVIGEEIKIEDAEVIIKLSKQNFRKSVTAYASPMQLAKLMSVLKATVQKSIGVERHDNRYFFDSDTVYFDNLLGGYIEGEDFVPVRFGLEYNHTGNVVLYVVVDQNKIPLSSLTATKNDRGRQSASLANADSGNSRSVTYSIAQIIKFVNREDLLRYIPDEMLIEVQKTTKYEAIAKTIEKTNAKNDERHLEYIRGGNLWEARRRV